MLTASHPRDSEVIHWLVWRAHIPRWLQLAPRELESSVTCGSRSLDHFHYSSGKYVLFTDGRQRDNSKFPYPHKPYPPLKEPSLLSILYWARRVVFNIPIEYSPAKLQLSQQVLDSRHPTIFLTSCNVTLWPGHLNQNIEQGRWWQAGDGLSGGGATSHCHPGDCDKWKKKKKPVCRRLTGAFQL